MRLTTKEMQDFKALFVKYCQQEASLGHCEFQKRGDFFMKLYAIVEQNQNRNSGAISVPFCLDSYDEAMKKVKELALSLLPQKAPKGSNFPWLSAALDDLVDNERECRVEASSGNFVFSFSHVPSGIRFQETGGTNIQWTVREIGSIQLGKTSMADIADGYNYELVRTSVLYSLRDRYPGLDETPQSVQELIDNLASRAYKDIGVGCDEDWSVDEAFRTMANEVRQICEAEY